MFPTATHGTQTCGYLVATEVLGPQRPWKFAVDGHDPNIVHFFYPPAIHSPVDYIARKSRSNLEPMPNSSRTVSSQFAPSLSPSFQRFSSSQKHRSLAFSRNEHFGEKATILHAGFHRPPAKNMPDRYSRIITM